MNRGLSKTFALAVGVVYVLVGVVGFAVTGFSGLVADTDAALLGFDLNPFHNIVHLAIGAFLIAVSRVDVEGVTEGVLIGGGLVYVLAAVLGFTNNLQLLSINDVLAPDNFLHLVSGVLAIVVGAIGARSPEARTA